MAQFRKLGYAVVEALIVPEVLEHLVRVRVTAILLTPPLHPY